MRIWISAMLLASTVAAGVPAVAQDRPPQDRGDRAEHGDRGDHGNRGGDHQQGRGPGAPASRPGQSDRDHPDGGRPGGDRPDGGQPGPGVRPPQGDDPRQQGHAGGDPRSRPGWQGQPGGDGGFGGPGGQRLPGGQGGYRGPLPGQNGDRGWNGQRGPDGRGQDRGGDWNRGDRDHGGDWNRGDRGGPDRGGPGRGPGWNRGPDRGAAWNRGWRDDRRYDWQGYRQAHRDIYRGNGYRAPGGYRYRRFGIGASLAPAFFAQQYWIGDPGYYRLPPAYGPYRWVRYFNDALLVDVYSGRVVDAIPGFFY